MSKIIAFAGKGGVGKTTVASLVIRHLSVTRQTPILAVDADPNSNLGETLGLEVTTTVGDIRENFMRDPARRSVRHGQGNLPGNAGGTGAH